MTSYREKDDMFYTVTDGELIEDAGLLPGEMAPDPDLADPDDEDIPVRLLDSFVIYDWNSLRLVPMTQLVDIRPGMNYGASGLVSPWTNDDVDDDSSEDASVTPLAIKLSPILELNAHHFSPATGSLDV